MYLFSQNSIPLSIHDGLVQKLEKTSQGDGIFLKPKHDLMTFLVCDIQRFSHLSFSFLSLSQHQIKSYVSFSCTNQSDSFPQTHMPPVTPPHLSFPARFCFFFLFYVWCPSFMHGGTGLFLCMVALAMLPHMQRLPHRTPHDALAE